MKIAIDTHTHSVASGHAYSTIDDLARGARKQGLKGFVLTDHGPGMPGATHAYHFGNLRVIPRHIRGVRFFSGIEANIMDDSGGIDLAPFLLARLDFVLAGFHEICFAPRSREENTRALVATIANPWVDAISHPGNPAFPVDLETVVRAAAEHGTALEINDSSFRIRRGSDDNCLRIAQLCVQYGAPIVCGSDAHYWQDVGRLDTARALLKKAAVPATLVLNASFRDFEAFADQRRRDRRLLAAGAPPAQ
jgi:putative hydrolase